MILWLGFLIAIGLTIWFVVFSDASAWTKIVAALLFVVSLLLHGSGFSIAGLFLQFAMSIAIAFYLKAQQG
jgi:hypothetical protein